MSKIDNLIKLQQHRQIGNTSFMLRGMSFNRPAVFVFANISHARNAMEQLIRDENIDLGFVDRASMTIGKIAFRSVSILADEKYSYYWGTPVQIDHFALALLVQEEQKRIIKMMEKK